MFYSFDLVNFGIMLRDIRKNNRFSQQYVRTHTGIHEDTLRKLENGLVIPKYETLEILSAFYKCDLLRELEHYRINEHFYKYYRKMDRMISNNEFNLIDELIAEFKADTSAQPGASLLVSNIELKQFELFLSAIKEYSRNDVSCYQLAACLLLDAIKLTIYNFKIDTFEECRYNLFEIRLLLLYGLAMAMLKESSLSTNILLFVLRYLINGYDDDLEVQTLVLKIYTNLSYNYHKEDNNVLALKYANEGIDYAVHHSNMSFLFLLYGRKGIAEFLLNNAGYLDSLQKSIHLLEINKQFDLADTYKNTYLKKYKISL